MKKVFLLFAILILCGCNGRETTPPEDLILKVNSMEVPVYSDLHLFDLIGENNVIFKSGDRKLDTTNLGEQRASIEYKFKNKKYKTELKYNVVDKIAPVFIQVSSYITTKVNDDLYPCEKAVYGDNYDPKPSCEIIGEADLTKVGKYSVKYKISDSSGNFKEKNLTINVVKNLPSNNTTTTTKQYLYYNDAIKKYKTEDTMMGIDVSRWQEDIDFEKVKNAGVEFVIMRMAIHSDWDKEISIDTYFDKNIKNAKAAGLKVGVYVYTTATNKQTALEHAEYVASYLKGEKLDFPIAYDWENWRSFKKYGISIYELSECVNVFADTLKKYGYETMLYSSKFYLENIWMNKNNLPVWLAHYTSKTNYEGKYIMWQLSNQGRVDGIKGDVDIDVFYKNKKEN